MSAETVVHGLSHIDVPVRDLERALAIYRTTLGFGERSRGEGWADLDAAGTITLRVLQVRRVENRAALRVQAGTVEALFNDLLASGCTTIYEPRRTAAQELEGRVADPDGHTLHVWRPLTEDEYDFVPELPKEIGWRPDAEALLKSLLKSVPALFRGLARRKVVRVAEELAGDTGLVTSEELIRGFILASPRVTRGRNRQPLLEHGVDVNRYRADWDAD